MALPPGFDLNRMTFGGVRTAEMPRHENPTSTTTSYHESLWSKMNSAICSFGNWLDDCIGKVTEWTLVIMMIALYGGAAIWVFQAENLLWGVARLIGAFFIVGIGVYVVTIASYIWGAMLKIIRFCFWNIYTLLLAIGIVVGLCLYASNSSSASYSSSTPTSVYASPTTTYVCTARTSLKVRSYPTPSSSQIGSLIRGEEVEVLDISDGFAHVKWNGQDGYVSTKYLRKK